MTARRVTMTPEVKAAIVKFKKSSDVILANRFDEALADVKEKVSKRYLFRREENE